MSASIIWEGQGWDEFYFDQSMSFLDGPTQAIQSMNTFWESELPKAFLTRGNTILVRNKERLALFVVCEIKQHTFNLDHWQQMTRAMWYKLDIATDRPGWTGRVRFSNDPTSIMVIDVLRPELRHVKNRLQDLVEKRSRQLHLPDWLPRGPRIGLPGWYRENMSWAELEQYASPLSTVDVSNSEVCIHPHDLVINKILRNNKCQNRNCVDGYDNRSRADLYDHWPDLEHSIWDRFGDERFFELLTLPSPGNTPSLCVHCFGDGVMFDELLRLTTAELFHISGIDLDSLGSMIYCHLALVRRMRRAYGYSTHAGQLYAQGDFQLAENDRLFWRPPTTIVQPDIKRVLAEYQSMEFWRMTEPSNPGWNEMCAICREEYTSVATIVRLQCRHHFHERCLADWFSEAITCPMCQRKVTGGEVEVQPPPELIGSHDEYSGFIDSP